MIQIGKKHWDLEKKDEKRGGFPLKNAPIATGIKSIYLFLHFLANSTKECCFEASKFPNCPPLTQTQVQYKVHFICMKK